MVIFHGYVGLPEGNKDDCKFKEISPRQIGGLTNKNGD